MDAVWDIGFGNSACRRDRTTGCTRWGAARGTTDGLVQIDDERTSGFAVMRGFSGAPVWDETVGGVIGIAAQMERDARRRTAYFILGAVLGAVWPELSRLGLQRPPFASAVLGVSSILRFLRVRITGLGRVVGLSPVCWCRRLD
jgi:hypothetical protein